MTSKTVQIPDIGDASNVEVIEICTSVGETVDEGDALIVIESEKASMEVPAPFGGTVDEILVELEATVNTGDQIVVLGTDDGASAGVSESSETDSDSTEVTTEQQTDTNIPEPPIPPIPPTPPSPTNRSLSSSSEDIDSTTSKVYAGPAVRKLARELGVDLTLVLPTGAKGRIVKDDVKVFVKQRLATPATGGIGIELIELPDFSKFGEVDKVALSRIRRRGAQNLHRNWLNVAHVTQHEDADVTELEMFRHELNANASDSSEKLTPLPFILKISATVLKLFPQFNASIDPNYEYLVVKKFFNIGVAVDTPNGLIVPVIRGVDTKGIRTISTEAKTLATAAIEKKLHPDDLAGATFTVSSLGNLGGTGFTPIVNAPEVAILGVGRMTTRPVWRQGAVVPRKILPLSLSYDHRAINGAEAGRFVQALREHLADFRKVAL